MKNKRLKLEIDKYKNKIEQDEYENENIFRKINIYYQCYKK